MKHLLNSIPALYISNTFSIIGFGMSLISIKDVLTICVLITALILNIKNIKKNKNE